MLSRLPRRYRRYRRYTKPVKYSNETSNFAVNIPIKADNYLGGQILLIDKTMTQGMRKAKNFTLTLTCITDIPIQFALVYVPEGTQPTQLNIGVADNYISLYEPNQNVILSGILPVNSGYPITKFTPLARNLNSGDQIFLCLRSVDNYTIETDVPLCVQLNYAITY